MNKQLFIDKLNASSKYLVNIGYVENLMKNTEDMKEVLKQDIITATSVDPSNKKAMMAYIKGMGHEIDKYTNTALEELLEATDNQLFNTLIKFNKALDKHTKLIGFYNNLSIEVKTNYVDKKEYRIATISPTFALNINNAVTLSKPSLPFSTEDIKQMLGYSHSLVFSSLEEIANFLRKYKELIESFPNFSTFLIANTTIYINITTDTFDIIPDFSQTEKDLLDIEELIKEFNNEFYPKEEIEEKIELMTEVKVEVANIEEKIDEKVELITEVEEEVVEVIEPKEHKEGDITEYSFGCGHFIIDYSIDSILKGDFEYLKFVMLSQTEDKLKGYTQELLTKLIPWNNDGVTSYTFTVDTNTANITASVEFNCYGRDYVIELKDYQFNLICKTS